VAEILEPGNDGQTPVRDEQKLVEDLKQAIN